MKTPDDNRVFKYFGMKFDEIEKKCKQQEETIKQLKEFVLDDFSFKIVNFG